MKDIPDIYTKKPTSDRARGSDQGDGHANALRWVGRQEKDREAAGQTPPASVPTEILQRYSQDKNRFFHDRAKSEIALEDRGNEFKLGKEPSTQAIRDALLIAQTRGWTDVALAGTAAFIRDAYVEARLLGLNIRNYVPDKETATALQARRDQMADQLLRDKRPARPEPALARAYAHMDGLSKALDGRQLPFAVREVASRSLKETLARQLKEGGEIKPMAAPETYRAQTVALQERATKTSVSRVASMSPAAHDAAAARAAAIRQFAPKDWPQTDDRHLAGAYAALREIKETIDRAPTLTPGQKEKIFVAVRSDVASRLERGQSLSEGLTAQSARPTRAIHRDLTRDHELDR